MKPDANPPDNTNSSDSESVIVSGTGTAMFRSLTGDSPGIVRLRELIRQLEGSLSTVLVLGESGTGKEIVARNLHFVSGRHEAPFVAVNCAAVSPDAFAEEFYGVVDRRHGLIGEAEGGTLFLDRVDELPALVQAGLLRFLETLEFTPVNSNEARRSDVRIIAATHNRIEDRVREGAFRRDLYYRLNVIPVEVPPLRARREDIPALIKELLLRLAHSDRPAITFNSVALKSLQCHDWPGNVRELANVVERLCILHGPRVVGLGDLPEEYRHDEAEALLAEAGQNRREEQGEGMNRPGPRETLPPVPAYDPRELLDESRLKSYLASFERELLQVALDDCDGEPGLTAQRLEVDEARLSRMMGEHGL